MTSLDRAKAFLKSKARRSALVVVPLALAAVNANATVILALGNADFNSSGRFQGPISNETPEYEQLPEVGEFTGFKFWGTSSMTNSVGSIWGPLFGMSAYGGPAPGFALFTTDSIVINYSFTASHNSSVPLEWLVYSSIAFWGPNGYTGRSGEARGIMQGESETLSGSFTIRGLEGAVLDFWSVSISLWGEQALPLGDVLTLEIPPLSLDVAGDPNAVPEPATGLLAAFGAGLLHWTRRWLGRSHPSATSRK